MLVCWWGQKGPILAPNTPPQLTANQWTSCFSVLTKILFLSVWPNYLDVNCLQQKTTQTTFMLSLRDHMHSDKHALNLPEKYLSNIFCWSRMSLTGKLWTSSKLDHRSAPSLHNIHLDNQLSHHLERPKTAFYDTRRLEKIILGSMLRAGTLLETDMTCVFSRAISCAEMGKYIASSNQNTRIGCHGKSCRAMGSQTGR